MSTLGLLRDVCHVVRAMWHRLRQTPAMADVTVRNMTVDDLAWAHALNQANVPEVGSETADAFAHLLDVAVVALIAELDGTPSAMAIAMLAGADYHSTNYAWFCERYAHPLYLDRIAVAASARRHGLGRMLYAEVERRGRLAAPEVDMFCLEVNTEPRNDVSLAFHHALGFDDLAERDTPKGIRVMMMARPIT